MPFASPLRRAMGATFLVVFVALAGPASVFAAQPTPGYAPKFVTEREAGPWEDCIWAAAAMLLDKWTTGSHTVGRERLRGLSGDHEGGSNLGHVRRAFNKLGVDLPTSPAGGAFVTWKTLLSRLADGGGAILLGDYGQLPRRYGRWDPEFWARTGSGDDHALYLDRYDRRTGRILVMDPLAPAGWGGEWIPLSALKLFAWRTGGGTLSAALTPAARVIPAFEGVSIGPGAARVDLQGVHIAWQLTAAPRGWAYQGSTLSTELVAVGQVDPALPVLQAPAAKSTGTTPWVNPGNGVIEANLPLPTSPGLYRLTTGLAETASGRLVAAAGPYSLYVPGPVAATLGVPGQLSLAAGQLVHFPVLVSNVGTESWADPPPVGWLPIEAQRAGEIRLVARWLPGPMAGQADTASSNTGTAAAAVPGPYLSATTSAVGPGVPAFEPPPTGKADLGPLHLDTGEQGSVVARVQAPAQPGRWWLVFEVIDEGGRSLALSGSAPGIVVVEVRPAEGDVPLTK